MADPAPALYPGSFDPITNGHLDVIERAARLFDHVLVAVADNNAKNALFSTEDRVSLIRQSVSALPNVKVTSFKGLLVDFAAEIPLNNNLPGPVNVDST